METLSPKRLKFTVRVKRGLTRMRDLTLKSFDPSEPPSETQIKRWRASERADYEAALAWVDQIARDLPAAQART